MRSSKDPREMEYSFPKIRVSFSRGCKCQWATQLAHTNNLTITTILTACTSIANRTSYHNQVWWSTKWICIRQCLIDQKRPRRRIVPKHQRRFIVEVLLLRIKAWITIRYRCAKPTLKEKVLPLQRVANLRVMMTSIWQNERNQAKRPTWSKIDKIKKRR